jgi:hypothetical protein
VACAKFGWADIRAAFWLRRVDPNRRRGGTCFWCYLTFGLWKVAVMSTLVMILLGFLGSLFDPNPRPAPPNNGPSPVLGGALVAAGFGFCLSVPAAYVALGSALRSGVRIWLGAAPHRARRGRYWPPCQGKVNFAPYVGFTTLILTVWFGVMVILGLVLVWRPRGPAGPVLIGIVLLGFISSLLTAFSVLAGRLFARSPRECWPAESGEAAYQAAEGAEAPDRFG